jgi:membrane-anchored protein YejM (alkaline phosphatase superfamily)
MNQIMEWALPVLFVAMLIWTIWMWSRLENNQRLIAIAPLLIIAYSMLNW